MSEGEAPKAEAKVANGKMYDLEEVKKHTREDDCWLVVDGDVFDVTDFLDEHPGGFDIIISNTGTVTVPLHPFPVPRSAKHVFRFSNAHICSSSMISCVIVCRRKLWQL